MLGTLAKWLRILGYDTLYDNQIEDDDLILRCAAEGRIALTRDVRLTQRSRLQHAILISDDSLLLQIQEVLNTIGEQVDPERVLSRCVECNDRIQTLSREAVRDRVPAYVFEKQSHFRGCPTCCRIYWGGTHRERILERLAPLLPDVDTKELSSLRHPK